MNTLKKILVCLVYLSILFFKEGSTQNLIANPSFEKVTEITNRWSGTFSAFNKRILHWDSPTQSSPDILFVKTLGKMYPKRPKVNLQKHRPRTGKFMVGIKAFGCLTNALHCKEYLQIKLKSPLEKGKRYAYEFWINPVSTSVKVNSFGIALSNTRLKEYRISGLLNIAPIAVDTSVIDSAPNDWQRIAGVFHAPDTSNFFILGNFSADTNVVYKIEEDGLDYAYYLIDDISLIPLDTKKPAKEKEVAVQTIILKDFLFDFDKTVLKDSTEQSLVNLVNILKNQPYSTLQINGHTDNVGTSTYNIDLSRKRATAIKKFLCKEGIPEHIITVKGLGSVYPIVNNTTAANRQQNRRVEIIIIP